MNCPSCKTELKKVKDKNSSAFLLSCIECNGKAVLKEDLEKVIEFEAVKSLFKLVPDKLNTLECPSCLKPMHEYIFDPDKTYLKLDICDSCHLIWFDLSEFYLLQKSSGKDEKELLKIESKALIEKFKQESMERVETYKRQSEFLNAFSQFLKGVIFGPRRF